MTAFFLGIAEGSAEGTDDPRRERTFESEGITDGENLLTDLDVVRTAEVKNGQVTGSLNLNQGEIAARLGSEHASAILFMVREGDRYLLTAANHVVVGDDLPFLVDDESRADALRRVDLHEPAALIDDARDIDGGEMRRFVNIDIVLFVGFETGPVGGLRRGPEPSRVSQGPQKAANSHIRTRCDVPEAAEQQRCQQQSSSSHT